MVVNEEKNVSLSLPDIFQDNMVIPCQKQWRLTGKTGSPNTEVIATIADHTNKCKTNDAGEFEMEMPALAATNDSLELIISADLARKTISSVHVGKVFLMSGQSNIEFRLKDAATFQDTLENFPIINGYYYEVPQLEYEYQDGRTLPDHISKVSWLKISKVSCGNMSAVAFYAAVRYQQAHPSEFVGIVDCYKGGTSASAWVDRKLLEREPELASRYIEPFDSALVGKTEEDFDRESNKFWARVDQHKKKLNDYLAKHPDVTLSDAKNIVGHTPWPFPPRPESYLRPGGLYQTMFSKIASYTFSALIWYQGENDADHPETYDKLLSLLINSWRSDLKDRSLPTYVVQLPGYADATEGSWATIRQQQLAVVQQLPNVWLISGVDGGETHNIHPANKRPLGNRIGRILSGHSYQETPIMNVISWTNSKVTVSVHPAKIVIAVGEAVVTGIDAAGMETIVPVQVSGNMLTVTGNFEQIKYADSNFPRISLYNEYGDPVSPARFNRGQD